MFIFYTVCASAKSEFTRKEQLGNANMKELRKDSVVRGHHIYKSILTPVIGEELNLECEESNEHDEYAVAVRKNGETVGQRI